MKELKIKKKLFSNHWFRHGHEQRKKISKRYEKYYKR